MKSLGASALEYFCHGAIRGAEPCRLSGALKQCCLSRPLKFNDLIPALSILARFRCSIGTRSVANIAQESGKVFGALSSPEECGLMLTASSCSRQAKTAQLKLGTDARSTRRGSLHCRLGRCYSHTRAANETTHPLLPSLSSPFRFSSLKRESMQSTGSYKAMVLCLSLTVGDSGRLRSLSTETLQHMRSFLKEWSQNPH